MVLVAADGRRHVVVRGEDRWSFLDAVLSQQLAAPTPGTRTQALWLDVHGAPLAEVDVLVDPSAPEAHLVVVDELADLVVEGLGGRTFLAQATFELDQDVVVALRDLDPGLRATMAADGAVTRDGGLLVAGRRDGVDLVGPALDVDGWLDEHDLGPVRPLQALLDHEVRSGVPRAPFEVVGPHLPEELGLLPTHVHLAKGCYPGQEAVARMWMLGRPRRVLVVLDVEGNPRPGSEAGSGRERWRVTRVTSDGEPRRALALAPAATGVGDRVEGDGWAGRVVGVVGHGLEQPGADPSVTRRRDRASAAD